MKIRASKNIHFTGKTLEEFKLTELSKNLDVFTPDLTLSCSQCEEDEDETKNQDSVLSFLVKFKADKVNDPQKFIPDGVEGLALPETAEYKYKNEEGEKSFFASVVKNHYNLNLEQEQVENLARELYGNEERRRTYGSETVGKYLIAKYDTGEWSALLSSSKKKNWKKYVKQRLKQEFRRTYCDLKRNEIEQALKVDPNGLKHHLKKLNAFDCLEGVEKDQIRQALGKDFV